MGNDKKNMKPSGTVKRKNPGGLRIVSRKGVPPDVRRAILKFAAWLRLHYDFPIRLTIYLLPEEKVFSSSGEESISIFFEPIEKTGKPYPYIKLATGDYQKLIQEGGNVYYALYTNVSSIILHVVQYFNWYYDKKWSKKQIQIQREKLLHVYVTDDKSPLKNHMQPNNQHITGIKVVARKGVHPDVRRAMLKFTGWLRNNYDFPIHLNIYLLNVWDIYTSWGKKCTTVYREPLKTCKKPIIKCAVADYTQLILSQGGKNNALYSIIYDVAKYFIYYQSWCLNKGWSKSTINRRYKTLLQNYTNQKGEGFQLLREKGE